MCINIEETNDLQMITCKTWLYSNQSYHGCINKCVATKKIVYCLLILGQALEYLDVKLHSQLIARENKVQCLFGTNIVKEDGACCTSWWNDSP